MESEIKKKILHIKNSQTPNIVSNTKAPIFSTKNSRLNKLMDQKFDGGDGVGCFQSEMSDENSCEEGNELTQQRRMEEEASE